MAYKSNMELGNEANRNAMKDFRIYMAVGGMPQAVERYIATNNFEAKYSKYVGERYLLSQKDVGKIGTLKLKPIYMILFLLKDL